MTSAINAYSIVGTLIGNPNETSSLCSDGPSPEQIFAIRPTQSGRIEISAANPGTNFDPVIQIRSNCSDPESESFCGIFGASFEATACTTYYIIVEGFSFTSGDFELTISQPEGSEPIACHGDGATPAEPAEPAEPADPSVSPATPPTFACEHDVCLTGIPLTSNCSSCTTTICDFDSYCCSVRWDAICVQEVEAFCGLVCASECGDFFCEEDETCDTCATDCGECAAATAASTSLRSE